MSIASHYESKATDYASVAQGNTYATLLLAHHQHTANLIAYSRAWNLTAREQERLMAVVEHRLGLKDL